MAKALHQWIIVPLKISENYPTLNPPAIDVSENG